MKNKIFTRIIITTLLCAFLTVNVGKVTRVSAVGTTIAASAAAALCAVGIVYCSYMALTGASVHVPDTVENIETWLTDMGTKVVQYPAGREAYNELYTHNLALSPEGNLIRDFIDSEVWTWTAAKLRSWANDFSSTDVISDIAGSYFATVDTSLPTTDYAYEFTSFELINDTVNVNGSYHSLSSWYGALEIDFPDGQRYIFPTNDDKAVYTNLYSNYTFRNALRNGTYTIEYLDPSTNTWVTPSVLDFNARVFAYQSTDVIYWLTPQIPASNDSDSTWYQNDYLNYTNNALRTYPPLADADIYDYDHDINIPVVVPSDIVVQRPQWPTLPPEDDNKPVIPYVKLPYDPNWVDPLGGPSGGGNWGLRLGDLLDLLEELAGLMMEIGSIGELINQFKDLIDGQSGDEYYIYYDDSTNNYYQYYTITNFGDNIYNYDIDVSEADEHLPVDLNTIQTYSSNRYLEQIKQSAINGSSIVRDFAVFWYDVDPEVTYIALGICVLILLGAFTGKLGHS